MAGGDSVRTQTRKAVEDYYQTNITEFYASIELFTIARECSHGNLHLHDSELIVEVMDSAGKISTTEGTGTILVTRLFSEAMPLIRYQIGDDIKLEPNNCTCGKFKTPIVRKIYGRSWDYIKHPSGEIFSANSFVKVMDNITDIHQFQIVQKTLTDIQVNIVSKILQRSLKIS